VVVQQQQGSAHIVFGDGKPHFYNELVDIPYSIDLARHQIPKIAKIRRDSKNKSRKIFEIVREEDK